MEGISLFFPRWNRFYLHRRRNVWSEFIWRDFRYKIDPKSGNFFWLHLDRSANFEPINLVIPFFRSPISFPFFDNFILLTLNFFSYLETCFLFPKGKNSIDLWKNEHKSKSFEISHLFFIDFIRCLVSELFRKNEKKAPNREMNILKLILSLFFFIINFF